MKKLFIKLKLTVLPRQIELNDFIVNIQDAAYWTFFVCFRHTGVYKLVFKHALIQFKYHALIFVSEYLETCITADLELITIIRRNHLTSMIMTGCRHERFIINALFLIQIVLNTDTPT